MSNSVINMRVTANSIQGHRKYMEDCYKIRFQRESSLHQSKNQALLRAANTSGYLKANAQSSNDSDIMFSYFGIFDGHGGKEASQFAKEYLYLKIVESEDFWSNEDAKVLNAIKEGYMKCQLEMFNQLDKWPKTPSGLPSTSGSTATVLFIRNSKAYVGHVGDSGLVIGYTKKSSTNWLAKKLTKDHKPEDPVELKRIESSGGSVVMKGGVNRVVWNRPIVNKKKTSQVNSVSFNDSQQIQTERVPFLAVSRSLGDLWSYDPARNEFIVSPTPDVFCFNIDPRFHKCLILATDGLWNMLRASECVELVRLTDKETQELNSNTLDEQTQPFVNPSQRLNNVALQRCNDHTIRADNTTCITIMIDQPVDSDEFLLNGDDSIIKGADLTANKTFDNKTRNFNDSEFYNENILSCDKRLFNQTTSTTLDAEFTTPSNKRSRSLTSLRRRHWSGSGNRLSNYSETKNEQKSHVLHNYEEINFLPEISPNDEKSCVSEKNSKLKRLSRSLRKSFNDLNVLKRNVNAENKENELPASVPNKSASKQKGKYSQKLKKFKSQLIQTKRSLFGKKIVNQELNTSKSMPDLNRIELNEPSSANSNEKKCLKENQSFVSNIKTKITHLKRNKAEANSEFNESLRFKRAKIF